jgi:hypothetical protein
LQADILGIIDALANFQYQFKRVVLGQRDHKFSKDDQIMHSTLILEELYQLTDKLSPKLNHSGGNRRPGSKVSVSPPNSSEKTPGAKLRVFLLAY